VRRLALLLAFMALAAAPAYAQSRVVTLGGDVTEIVYALGAGDQIVCDDQTSLYPATAAKLPQVGYLRTLAAEGVLSCKPDLVIASEDAGPTATMQQLEAAHVRIVHVTSEHNAAAVPKKIATIATALDKEAEGKTLIEKFNADLSAAQAKLARFHDRPRIIFLMAQGPGGAMAAGSGTAANAIMSLANADNAAAAFSGYKPLTAEAAIALAPDVIVVSDQAVNSLGGLAAIRKRPEIAATPAGKSGSIVEADTLLVLGFGPRLPQALETLANAVHQTPAISAAKP